MIQDTPFRMSDQVYQYLSDGIRTGRWKIGDKLPSEAELCRELDTSRTTVRGAIERLNGLGLAESIRGKGTFVRRPKPNEQVAEMLHMDGASRMDVFEFRKIIESESAALAAMRATAADVEALERTIQGMASGTTQREVASQDMEFHLLIATFSGNQVIKGVFEMMRPTYANMFMTNVAQLHKAGVLHHRRILLAIQSRDMKAARQLMLDHLEDTMRSVCQKLAD